jgi:cbb3-type cytochrome oxidase subunit 3
MDIGTAAFWIFLAAVVIAINWRNKHREAMKYEMVRFLIEKNQKLDEKQISQLLNPPPPPTPEWLVHKPGYAYRGLRATGIVFIFLALGLAFVAGWLGIMLGMNDKSFVGISTAVPLVGMVGAGLFFASRFCALPISENDKGNRDR